jgi:four helix bundle protein
MNHTGQTSKFKVQNSDKLQVASPKMQPFDFEERMSKFREDIVIFCRGLRVNHVSRPIVTQLVRSVTSIGANYAEANNASSKKDFRNKVHITKKEVQETKNWLRMLKTCYPEPERDEQIMTFRQEAHEFTLNLQTIVNKISQKVEV